MPQPQSLTGRGLERQSTCPYCPHSLRTMDEDTFSPQWYTQRTMWNQKAQNEISWEVFYVLLIPAMSPVPTAEPFESPTKTRCKSSSWLSANADRPGQTVPSSVKQYQQRVCFLPLPGQWHAGTFAHRLRLIPGLPELARPSPRFIFPLESKEKWWLPLKTRASWPWYYWTAQT